jgi:hypothetical protein
MLKYPTGNTKLPAINLNRYVNIFNKVFTELGNELPAEKASELRDSFIQVCNTKSITL